MSLNDDLEYLQDPNRTSPQRWSWLAAKLDSFNTACVELKGRTERDFVRLNGLEKRLDALEGKEAEARWLKRITSAAIVAAAASWAERLWSWGK